MTKRSKNTSPTTIITSHLNADFDALASAMAAGRLYPGAKIVLPGSQERGLREFLVQSSGYFLDVARLKDIDLAHVSCLVVVDTRQRNRLGPLAPLLDRQDVEVHVYDHHPPAPGDIEGARNVFLPVGANTTLMVKLLKAKGISISADEATFLMLGIYEDTGSFTFVSTTSEDLETAAWLLTQGADLKAVSELLSHRFTPEHVELLGDLLNTAVRYTMAGIPVTIAKTSSPGYVEDFAVLAHELMDMEKLSVVFAMALMEGQVLIVGRSREKQVDVGEVLKELGGGGHPMAASATLRGVTLAEAEERLLTALQLKLGRQPKVADIMSSPVLSVSPESTVLEVHDQLTRFGVTVLPIVQDGVMQGLISRRTVEKAIYHGLGDLPAKEYMSVDFVAVSPTDTFSTVQDIIVTNRQRFVPVVSKGKIVGVITRTDLLQILTGDPTRQPEPLLAGREQRKNVAFLLREKLPKQLQERLSTAGKVAESLGFQVYVVGGFVRDLLLRRDNFDVDMVVEGDGIAFARKFGEEYGARIRAHKKFQTAVLIFPDGFKIDVATTRWEYYEYPAAMPTIGLSSIKLDLFRRDFTINTLAIKLNPAEFGTLIDFFGGQKDLKDRIVRVLHSLSFIEDPTRVFRAVRFEKRYGFRIGKHTLRLIHNAVRLNIFAKLSGKRLLAELRMILSEPDPRPAIFRLEELGLLRVISKGLRLNQKVREALDRTYDVLAWHELLYRPEMPQRWIVYLLVLFEGLRGPQFASVLRRLENVGTKHAVFLEGRRRAKKALQVLSTRASLKNSQIYRLLHGLDVELLLYLLAITSSEQARQAISRYITEFQNVRPSLGGEDLKKLGLVPGPIFKKILDRLLEARLDGKISKSEDEIALVRREFGLDEQEKSQA